MTYVFPNCVTVVGWEGGRIHLNPSQQWRADDPFVLARPEFFDIDPVLPSTTEPPVERATAAPGERRTVVRPTSSKSRAKTTGKGSVVSE